MKLDVWYKFHSEMYPYDFIYFKAVSKADDATYGLVPSNDRYLVKYRSVETGHESTHSYVFLFTGDEVIEEVTKLEMELW